MWKCRVESISYLVRGSTWWRHQMETFSALLAFCAGNSPVTGEFPPQRPVTRSFDVFLDLRLNKRFSKQSWGWLFEMTLCPLWRHCNDLKKQESTTSFCQCNYGNGLTVTSRHGITGSQRTIDGQVCASFVISLNQLLCNSRVVGDLKRNGAHVMSLWNCTSGYQYSLSCFSTYPIFLRLKLDMLHV